jgi:argininosuccinate lyase
MLTTDELTGLERELTALANDFRNGAFVLDAQYEDGHSAIEARLTERLGDAGRRIHAGRSRNDQVLVATRLWLKEKLARTQALSREVAGIALDRAQAERDLPMPGYTHLQRAVVSSAGMWWAGWAEAFIDNAQRAADTRAWVDANPLGTAAGYGVNLPLDRDHVTQALGFARLQVSPLYAQLSRGKFELAALEALNSAMLDLRRLAWDLSLFTTGEFGFVRLPAQYTTGSSIMPNKRNPDVVELMRGTYASVAAARSEIEHLLSLPGGYHRDLQITKGALFHGFGKGLAALALLPDLLRNLEWNVERMQAALEPSMYATDLAVDMARQGMPFREAYKQAADPQRWAEGDANASLAARTSPGGAGDLRLEALRARLIAP